MNRTENIKPWTIQDSARLYGIGDWGPNFFSISEKGEIQIKLACGDSYKWVSLYEIALGCKERGLTKPILLRFPDILKSRLEYLNNNFQETIKALKYQGTYRGVYPIKVNQQQEVIEDISLFGDPFRHGLEAGSKAEFIIALAYTRNHESLIVCNGYKDAEFIDLALFGTKMGYKVILVVERPRELETIISRSKQLGIKPNIGLRVKLSSTVKGKWAASAGDHSPFGLTVFQILAAIDLIKQNEMTDCLKLLHYHLGSQIPEIGSIRQGVGEGCRIYAALVKAGFPMGYLDIGGGLAVDYDGSKTNFASSRNYTIPEYCRAVTEVIMTTLDEEEIAHPTIVTESGRSIVAYYSVLLFNILDVNSLRSKLPVDELYNGEDDIIRNLKKVYETVTVKNLQTMYHDAVYYRSEIISQFAVGNVGLKERGVVDQLFWKIIAKINRLSKSLKYIPEELQGLEKILVDIYYGNFSIFQSLPDSWAIDQLFPIMPIHRLQEKPSVPAVISDITCDCDGIISQFIDLYDVKPYLPLHEFNYDEEYIIGTFLVGAYQETLGDLHNLFGDTKVVSITLDSDGDIQYGRELNGDSISDVLFYVEYDPNRLIEFIRLKMEKSIKQSLITLDERKEILKKFKDGIQGYTYFGD